MNGVPPDQTYTSTVKMPSIGNYVATQTHKLKVKIKII